jgi:hypothetical protein
VSATKDILDNNVNLRFLIVVQVIAQDEELIVWKILKDKVFVFVKVDLAGKNVRLQLDVVR